MGGKRKNRKAFLISCRMTPSTDGWCSVLEVRAEGADIQSLKMYL